MIIGISGKKGHGKDTVCKMIQGLIYDKQRENEGFKALGMPYWIDDVRRLQSTGWDNRKFAKKLKQGLEIDFPNEFSEELWEISGDEYRDGIMPSLGITRRQALQQKGIKHREINPLYWTNALMSEYVELPDRTLTRRANGIRTSFGYTTGEQSQVPQKFWNRIITDPIFEWDEKIKGGFPNWIITDVRFPDDEAKSIKDRGGLVIRVNNPRVGWTGDHASETGMDNYQQFDAILENNDTLDWLMQQVKIFLQFRNII